MDGRNFEQVRATRLNHTAHLAVRNHLFNQTTFDAFSAVPAEQSLVFVIHPDDAAIGVDGDGSLIKTIEETQQSPRGPAADGGFVTEYFRSLDHRRLVAGWAARTARQNICSC